MRPYRISWIPSLPLRGNGPLLPIRFVWPPHHGNTTQCSIKARRGLHPQKLVTSAWHRNIPWLPRRQPRCGSGVDKGRSAETARLSTIVGCLKRAVWGTPGHARGCVWASQSPASRGGPWDWCDVQAQPADGLCNRRGCLPGWSAMAVSSGNTNRRSGLK
jgi:hypothetical protein